MLDIEYLTDKKGNTKAVVIPIELWEKLMPQKTLNIDNLAESLEDYCLNKAMEEAKSTPLFNKETALQFLEDEIES